MRDRTLRWWLGMAVDLALRLSIVAFLVAIVSAPAGDPRFEDKGIGARTVFVILPLSLLVPAWWLWRRWRGDDVAYPPWIDSLYLSVFVLDLAGNVFGWYINYPWFHLIPHFHGTGAATVTAAGLLRLSFPAGLAVGNIGHILLEAQEYYSDVFLGTENVHGEGDIINDLLVGIAGSLLYLWVWRSTTSDRDS